MSVGRYILGGDEGHTPVLCADLMAWARWCATADRHVAQTIQGEVTVSTVFLGLDHRHFGGGPPILFETMTFRGETSSDGDREFARYSSWDDALAGHRAICRRVFVAANVKGNA